MPENTTRTIAAFAIIGLLLAGLVVGGVRLVKARNSHYAAVHTQSAATDQAPPQSSSTPEQSTANNPAPGHTSTPPASPNSSSASNNPTSPPNSPSPAAPNQSPAGPQSVAATGISLPEMIVTPILMMLAVFFGSRLVSIRAHYRRYLQP